MKKYWLLFIALFKKGRIKDNLMNIHELNLSGMMMIKPITNSFENNSLSIVEFQEELTKMQSNYIDLGFDIFFKSDKLSIEFNTSNNIVSTNIFYIEEFVEQIENLLKLIPEKLFMIQLNIKGTFNNIYEFKKFTISNNQNNVALNIIKNKRLSFRGM